MAVELESPQEAPVGTLLGDIVQDMRQLVLDQMNLFRIELKADLQRTLQAVIPIGAGALTLFTALILLGIGAANLINWLVPQWPAWTGFVIVGAAAAICGVALVVTGIYMLKSIKPAATALKGLEENVTWKTKN